MAERYPIGYGPLSRAREHGRGPKWRYVLPDKYGLWPIDVAFPECTPMAFGYTGGKRYFSVFIEGDFFDGVVNGWAHKDTVRLFWDTFGIYDSKGVVFLRERGEPWRAWHGLAIASSVWVELMSWPQPFQKWRAPDEATKREIHAASRRFAIFLRNIGLRNSVPTNGRG